MDQPKEFGRKFKIIAASVIVFMVTLGFAPLWLQLYTKFSGQEIQTKVELKNVTYHKARQRSGGYNEIPIYFIHVLVPFHSGRGSQSVEIEVAQDTYERLNVGDPVTVIRGVETVLKDRASPHWGRLILGLFLSAGMLISVYNWNKQKKTPD